MPLTESEKELFEGYELGGENGPKIDEGDRDILSGYSIGGQLVAPGENVTAQERAASLGAVPGVGVTPEQLMKMSQGEQIQPSAQTLRSDIEYKQVPPASGQPFAEAASQGALNIGSGLARTFGALVQLYGVDGAESYLKDLEVSQNIEQKETDIVTEGHPFQEFGGTVTGETLSFPVGGGTGGTLVRLFKAFVAGGTSGGLSAGGRGEEAVDVAKESALGGGFGVGGEGLLIANRARIDAKDAARTAARGTNPDTARETITESADNIAEAQSASAQTGIRTLPAQQSLDPFQLETQAFIGQKPEVSRKAYRVLKQQNKEAADAVTVLLNSIASPIDAAQAGTQARRGAGNIIDSAKLIRQKRTSPMFKRSFRLGADVDLDPVKGIIEASLKDAAPGGKIAGVIGKAKKMVFGDEFSDTRKPTLKRLHNAKIEIDEMLEARGDSAVGSTLKRELTLIKKQLVRQMEEASPEYKRAMDDFRSLSPAINALEDGDIGRLANLNNAQLKKASTIIFDASETNPDVLLNTINTFKGIEGGEDVIRGLLRNELERRLGRMRVGLMDASETGGRNLENLPRQLLNTVYGNSAQNKLLFTTLKELYPTGAKNARWLEISLSRAAAGRPGGSQTGIRGVIEKALRSSPAMSIRSFFKTPIEATVSIGEEAMFSSKVEALGQALYDPDWAPDMKRIRGLSGKEAASQFETLLFKIEKANNAGRTGTQVLSTGSRIGFADEETE